MSTGLEAKLVVLGQASVGKTSFVIRYCKGTFDPDSSSTIGASFLAKKVVVDDCVVRLQIWVCRFFTDRTDKATLVDTFSKSLRILLVKNGIGQYQSSITALRIVGYYVTT